MVRLPENIKEFSEELYSQYENLLEYEKLLDESILQQRYCLSDVWLTLMDDKSIRCYRKKMRVHIFNTYENQKPADVELESFNLDNDWTRKVPPSWTLKIQGSIIQSDTSYSPKFTSIFSKIIINLSDKETIIWDKTNSPIPECDGIEIHRIGDEEKDIDVFFFMDYRTPHYSLSKELEEFVGIEIASLPTIIKRMWQYIELNGLQNTQINHDSIKINEYLKNLLSVENDYIQLKDIPELLKKHLFPPKPVKIRHRLSLKGDWIDNESTYDFTIDLTENVPGDISLWFPNVSTRIQENPEFATISKSLEGLYHKNQNILSRIYHSYNKMNFYLGFSNNPTEFIHSLLTTKHFQLYGNNAINNILSDPNAIYEYQIADKYAEYYRQPWVPKAIQKYLSCRNKSFEERVNKTISSISACEKIKRRNVFNPDTNN
ncbi:RSC6 BAF60A with a SWIB domain [Cryptosporidium bovis]|uniref:RSC6 BAF60A with a SWIB domain n=1 Tax=Cryptosporidium bovis TaxID=310047 RepID=UPI00351A4AC9|nr:RSC6 BAF60A with a SWIB domain [Cryptosporidium bovis]